MDTKLFLLLRALLLHNYSSWKDKIFAKAGIVRDKTIDGGMMINKITPFVNYSQVEKFGHLVFCVIKKRFWLVQSH